MEEIKFCYKFDDDGEEHKIVSKRANENGITIEQCCNMFIDFMETCGYDLDRVFDQFKID